MLKFRLFGVPVGVEWWFWLVTAFLGGGATARDPEDLTSVLVWVAVVLVSILVHELGHAAAGRKYGATPSIRLHGFGGVTFLPGAHFTRGQHILVSAAGPAAGLALGIVVLTLSLWLPHPPELARLAIRDALFVNFFWTFVNLLPIQPLDGGQIFAQLLGPSRQRLSSGVGFVAATVLCLWALSKGQFITAFMLAMLGYYNLKQIPVAGGVITP